MILELLLIFYLLIYPLVPDPSYINISKIKQKKKVLVLKIKNNNKKDLIFADSANMSDFYGPQLTFKFHSRIFKLLKVKKKFLYLRNFGQSCSRQLFCLF